MAAKGNDNQGTLLEEALTRFVDEWLQGRRPDVDAFVQQYAQCEAQLKVRLQDLEEIDSLFDSLVQADENEFAATAAGHDLAGRTIGSFEIAEMIGRGGMGVVYLARDTKLKRSVAIKSMPAELQTDPMARMRFRREAELLASLNHANIGVIHDTQRIAQERLRLEEALSIGQQIAEAVSTAHDKGVIHRDLKPGNIRITPEGKVKVLDFGLAKASAVGGSSADTTVTQPGRVIGTPAYMSPEQACGKATDKRSDIWSFGCLMYEMLTRRLPFDGDSATEILARIIERDPDWQALPQDTPARISALLRRCLEKDLRQRLQHIAEAATEIRNTLNLLASGLAMPAHAQGRQHFADEAGPGRIKSLAVLPLQNLTGDPEQEYFADGMTEALIANVGKIGALQVRSRTSIMQYKDVKKSLPEIARELNVDAVVEGSLLRVAERVQITVQLIQGPTDTHIWADSYERDLRDVLTLFNEIARTIAGEIEITLTPDQEARLAARRPVNPETYNAYLKGMFHLNKETPEGTRIGLEYLHQAIEKDPSDPLAYGGLALGYVISTHAPGAPPDAFERAKAAALKALELDDNLTEAHAALAMAKVYREWDWDGAAKAYRRALQLNPNLTLTRAHYAFYLLLFDRVGDALAEMRRVQEVDPLTPLWPAWQGWLYLYPEQYDEAIKETNKSLELYSDFPVALYVQGCAYAGKGMYDRAIELHQKAGMLSPQWKCGLACTYAMAGRLDEARQALAELEADHAPWDTWFLALIHVALGERDGAFRWLEAAYGPPNHPYLPWMRCVPEFMPLRDDPRFADLLRRMKLPE
jgi:serine/threonine protein kinase/Flp pilus assembly protein TadD